MKPRTACKACIYAALIVITGCATNLPSVDGKDLNTVEREYWEELVFLKRQTDQLNEQLKRKGLIYRDIAVNQVVERVGRELVPADTAEVNFRFFIIKDPSVNAFALPDGSIYIHTGMLAMLENEAQLAMVLGHEIAYVIYRHSLEQVLTTRKTLIGTHITDIFLTGVGLGGFAYLGAAAGLASYNREQEREADINGIAYMAGAGYTVGEAPKVWALMRTQPGAAAIKNSIYSSHPDNASREEYLQELIAKNFAPLLHEGQINAEQYQDIKARLVELSIKLRIRHQQYDHADLLLDHAEQYYGETAKSTYYRGEVRRGVVSFPEAAANEKKMIVGKGRLSTIKRDIENRSTEIIESAKQFYLDAIALDKEFAPSYRGLGLLEGNFGSASEAIKYLKKYLELEKAPKDKRFILNAIHEFQGQ